MGANGVMVAGINGLKNDEQIENYFEQVVQYLDSIPICLQDYPPTTNVYFSVSTIEKIFQNIHSWKCLNTKIAQAIRN